MHSEYSIIVEYLIQNSLILVGLDWMPYELCLVLVGSVAI
jgi:hypothetical protein